MSMYASPLLQAYMRSQRGVEFLHQSTCPYTRPRVAYPAARAICRVILVERAKCRHLLRRYTNIRQTDIQALVDDLGTLAKSVYALYEYCGPITSDKESGPLRYDQVNTMTVPWETAKEYTTSVAALEEALATAYQDLEEYLAVIRQQLAMCRYTVRKIHPDHFGIPVFERSKATTVISIGEYFPEAQWLRMAA